MSNIKNIIPQKTIKLLSLSNLFWALLERIIDTLENDEMFINLMPYCEVQLGKRGLYPTLSAVGNKSDELKAMMWLLNYSDGKHSLFDIIQKSNINLDNFLSARNRLLEQHIIKKKS